MSDDGKILTCDAVNPFNPAHRCTLGLGHPVEIAHTDGDATWLGGAMATFTVQPSDTPRPEGDEPRTYDPMSYPTAAAIPAGWVGKSAADIPLVQLSSNSTGEPPKGPTYVMSIWEEDFAKIRGALEAEVAALTAERDRLAKSLDDAVQHLADEAEARADVSGQLTGARRSIEGLRTRMLAAEAERDRLREELLGALRERDNARHGRNETDQWADVLRQQLYEAEAERDRLREEPHQIERDLAAALDMDDWEHPGDLIAIARALRLADVRAADYVSSVEVERDILAAQLARAETVIEALPALIGLWQAWLNCATVEPTDPGYVEMLDVDDSFRMDAALDAVEPYEKVLLEWLAAYLPRPPLRWTPHSNLPGAEPNCPACRAQVELLRDHVALAGYIAKVEQATPATTEPKPMIVHESPYRNCACGHPWLRHDVEEYRGDGSETCCVEGCQQIGCPGRRSTRERQGVGDE